MTVIFCLFWIRALAIAPVFARKQGAFTEFRGSYHEPLFEILFINRQLVLDFFDEDVLAVDQDVNVTRVEVRRIRPALIYEPLDG